MEPALAKYGGSVIAVAALVALAWLLGFRGSARLVSEDEARELARLAPGGFEPTSILLDIKGRAAVARNARGELLALLPHGNRFVQRPIAPQQLTMDADGTLVIACEGRQFHLEPGSDAQGWATADINANKQ